MMESSASSQTKWLCLTLTIYVCVLKLKGWNSVKIQETGQEYYAVQHQEVNAEKQKVFINANFGGFEETVNPTVKVEDYDVSMSGTSAEFVSIGELSDEENAKVDSKFKDISYFDQTFLEEQEKVQSISRTNYGNYNTGLIDYIMGGEISDSAEKLATKPVYTQDFPGLTKKDFDNDIILFSIRVLKNRDS